LNNYGQLSSLYYTPTPISGVTLALFAIRFVSNLLSVSPYFPGNEDTQGYV